MVSAISSQWFQHYFFLIEVFFITLDIDISSYADDNICECGQYRSYERFFGAGSKQLNFNKLISNKLKRVTYSQFQQLYQYEGKRF